MADFFISYSKADLRWAEWIAVQVEAAGYSTLYQARDFRPGSHFPLSMQQAAAESARTIAVLSPSYLTSEYTQSEWAAAFSRDPKGEKGTLLPIRVRECELTGIMAQIVYIDLVDVDEDMAKAELLAGLDRGPRPSTTIAFPGGAPSTAVAVLSTTPPRRFPGLLPAVWNAPHHRNPHFTGRDPFLDDLHAALTAGGASGGARAVTGLGGIGKTQVVTEYAYRHAAEYEVVWWIRAEKPVTLAADFAALAPGLGMAVDLDQPAAIAAVRGWLTQHVGWLLTFDNANEPDDLRDYLPPNYAGHVLVTTRNQTWDGPIRSMALQTFSREDAAKFLLGRTGQTDEAAAKALAEELGDLPLALEQAASYVTASGRGLSAYLSLFQERQREMLQRGKGFEGYERTIATTLSTSIEAAERSYAGASDLLRLIAFLAPDEIPLNVFFVGAVFLPRSLQPLAADPLRLDDTIVALRRYSLVDRAGESLTVHRLVQAVVRDSLADQHAGTWAESAVRMLSAAFPSEGDDVRNWPLCTRLLSHALATADHAERLGLAAEATATLLNSVGRYARARAAYAEARGHLTRALRVAEAAYGPDHSSVASIANNLGFVLHALGDLSGARAHFEQALRIHEAVFGPDHPRVATNVNNVGGVLRTLGDLPGALAHFERALRIEEAAYGPDHPEVARSINNVGGMLHEFGNLPGALVHYRRALRIHEAADPDHPQVATIINNVGGVLRTLGDLPGALAHFERALRIEEAAYGPDHPEVATDINNLGLVLLDLGDPATARAHFERALRIDEACHGPNHPTVALRINNLGTALQALGDLVGARAHFERALRISEVAYGPVHPQVATTLSNLGGALQALGDLDGAQAQFERVLQIFEAAYGPDHPAVANTLDTLGIILRRQGDLDGARAHFGRAFRIAAVVYGLNHPTTTTIREHFEAVGGV